MFNKRFSYTTRMTDCLMSQSSKSDVVVVTSATLENTYWQYAEMWVTLWEAYGALTDFRVSTRILVPVHADESRVSTGRISESLRTRVIFVPVPPGVPENFVAQTSRLFAHDLLHVSPDTILMTSDVDMFPGTDDFFARIWSKTPEGAFVVARDVLSHDCQYPICYLSALHSTWQGAFVAHGGLEEVWRTWSRDISSADWFIDQRLAFSSITSWENTTRARTVRLRDSVTSHTRIDRAGTFWSGILRASAARFSDYHAHRNALHWLPIVRVILRRLRKTRRKRR